MIDHFEIKSRNFEQCREFYARVLPALGIELKWSDESAAGFGACAESKVRFLIEKSTASTPTHIAFEAADEAAVKQFYDAGLASGFRGNGEPGLREHYAENYYAAFLLDPDGNNVEAVVYL